MSSSPVRKRRSRRVSHLALRISANSTLAGTLSPRGAPSSPIPEIARREREEGSTVPPLRFEVVDQFATYFETFGLRTQGLFRLAGNSVASQELYESLHGEVTEIFLANYDMHTVAEAFKMYLRLQPESLLPTKVYEDFEYSMKMVTGVRSPKTTRSTETSSQDEIEILVQLCQAVPVMHKPILRRLLQLLWQMHLNSSVNNMTAANLSIIFGPCMVQNMNEEGMNISEVCQRSKEGVEMCRLLILNSQILLEALPEGRPFFIHIGRTPAFSPGIFEAIQGCGNLVSFQRGDTLISKGDTTEKLYMITEGIIRISSDSQENCFTLVTKQNPFVGDVPLLGMKASIMNVVAVTGTVQAVELSWNVVNCFLTNSPELAHTLFWSVAYTYTDLLSKLESSSTLTLSKSERASVLQRNVPIQVTDKTTRSHVTLPFSEQELFSDVLYCSLFALGMPAAKMEDFALFVAPTHDVNSKGFQMLVDSSTCEESLEQLDTNERICSQINPHSTARLSLILEKAKIRRKKQLNVLRTFSLRRKSDPHTDSIQLSPIREFISKAKGRKAIMEIYSYALIVRGQKRTAISLNNLKVHSKQEEPLSVTFSDTSSKKTCVYAFDSASDMHEALRYLLVLRTLNPSSSPSDISLREENPTKKNCQGRAIASKAYEAVPSHPIQIGAGDVVLITDHNQHSNMRVVEYGGNVGVIDGQFVSPVEEDPINTTLVQSCDVMTPCSYQQLPLPEQWNQLLEMGEVSHPAKDEKIIALGDHQQILRILRKGSCTVTRFSHSTGSTSQLCTSYSVEAGGVFGVHQILYGGASSVQVVVDSEECEMVSIGAEKLRILLERSECDWLFVGLLKFFALHSLRELARLSK